MISIETTLKTENYLLRIPDVTDIDAIFSATQFPDFNAGMRWDAPRKRDELLEPLKRNIQSWIKGKEYTFTIVRLTKPKSAIGRISIRRTEKAHEWLIGYWTHPDHQGKGVMTEVLKEIVKFGFTILEAQTILANYAIRNKASEKVLLKNGFKFFRHLDKAFQKGDQWVAENTFSLSRSQWKKKHTTTYTCDFCQLFRDSDNIIFENNQLIILLDKDPIAIGHAIICPKMHFTDFHEMPDSLVSEMMILAKQYILLLRRVFDHAGYSMMLHAGSFNDLKHCHIHLFPRNSMEEFQWTFSQEKLAPDATRFEVVSQLLKGHL